MNCSPIATPLLLSLIGLSSIAACASEPPEATYTVRDSAGVKIVESQAPAWGPNDGWSISAEPILEIGTRDGDEAFQLFRVTDAIRISDHKFAILNAGTHTVRIIDDGGRLVTEFGGPGDGPGEFRSLSSIHLLRGDTLLIWDGRRSQASYFDTYGNFVRSDRLVAPGTTLIVGLYSRRGRPIVVKTHTGPMTRTGGMEAGVYRDPAPLLLMSEDGALLDTIGLFPSNETYRISVGGTMGVGPMPFAKNTYVDRWGDHVIVGTADAMEVSVIDATGEVKFIFRYRNADLTVQDEDRDWYKGRVAEMATPQEESLVDMILDAMVFPETRAAYSDLKLDERGALWLRTGRHLAPFSSSREWTVFSQQGALLGTVLLPDRFEPFHFGTDEVLGVWKDEMDVEFVRVYGIAKGPENGFSG